MTTLGSVLSEAPSTPHFCAALAISTLRTCAPAVRNWVK
jgi:hypothetical protein